jgi:nucleoside phosphorylase
MPAENPRAVILTALPVEFKAVREFLAASERINGPLGNVYEQGTFEANGRTWEVGLAEIGAGDSGAALQTERAIGFFKPQVVLFVGVAGGIKDVDIGHVVASTKIYGYESGKAKETFQPRPTIGLSSFALEEEAKAEARSREQAWLNRLGDLPEPPPKAWVGPIAAGEKVIASTKSSVYQFLRSNYGDALAVEMEGYGFLQAVQERQQPVSAIVVRGISDLIDNKNDDTTQEPEEVRQEKASRHASAFAFQLLANFYPNVSMVEGEPASRRVATQVWESLFSALQEADLGVIAPLAQQVFEEMLTPEQRDPYPELNQLDSLEALRTVFERRDDLALAVRWVSRIIQAFENPPEGVALRPVSRALQDWYNQHRDPDPGPEPAKKPPGYLLIALDPQDDVDNVAFLAELHTPEGEVQTDLLPPDAKCTLDEPYEELFKLLSEAVRKARNIKTVEIFLSWRHLHKPVHEWKAKAGLASQPLKRFRGTLVRSLDRVTLKDYVEEWCEALAEQWSYLQGCDDTSLGNHCHPVTALDWDELATDLSQENPRRLVLKLLSALPEDEEELQSLLNVVLFSGVPIWFWSYTPPPDATQFSEAIDTLLSASAVKDSAALAEVIRLERQNLPDLALLCDCPTRLPQWVDWQSSRLRQPAAESSMSV